MTLDDHALFDYDLEIQDALDQGLLKPGTSAYGIAVQVIYQGFNSLSTKQRLSYQCELAPVLAAFARSSDHRARSGSHENSA